MNPECPITLRAIVHRVARARGVAERHIYSHRRDKPISEARKAVYWLARELPGMSCAVIGRLLADRDHTTVLRGAAWIEARRARDPRLAAELEALKAELAVPPRQQLAGMLADPDARAVARHIMTALDPVAASLHVSALDVAAMAARLIELETQATERQDEEHGKDHAGAAQ